MSKLLRALRLVSLFIFLAVAGISTVLKILQLVCLRHVMIGKPTTAALPQASVVLDDKMLSPFFGIFDGTPL